jgi:predicted ArsR family transcriptional regulator
MDIETLKQQIVDAYKKRAMVYYYLFDEMEKAFGQAEAQKIFKQATYRLGQDIQKQYAQFLNQDDFQGLAAYFRDSSPLNGELFHPEIEGVDQGGAILTMKSCPLVSAWKELGLSDQKIQTLCDVASAIDYGTFETDKTALSFTHQLGKKDSLCRLTIQKVETKD